MKKTIILVCIIMLSGFMPTPGNAEIVPGQAYVSPYIGWYSFEKDLKLKDNYVFGLRLGYNITDRWGVEGAFDYVEPNSKVVSESADVFGLRFDALYHFRPAEKLVPFLAAGIGGTRVEYPQTLDRIMNDVLFNYGAGVKYFISSDWALRADVRHLLVFNNSRQDWEATIGLTYLFGGKKKPVAAPAPRPAPAPAPAPAPKPTPAPAAVIDSDGDGVPDSLDKCPNTPKGVKVDKDGCPIDSDGDGVPDYLDKCPNTPKGVKVDKDGCPIPEKVAAKAPEKVSIALEIEFASGKADVKQKYDDEIKKVADFMKTYPDTTAVIEGHTDNVGKEAANVRLSGQRAENVKMYLVNKFSIASERLTAKGFGSSQPVADNKTVEGRQKNRRINAVIEAMKP